MTGTAMYAYAYPDDSDPEVRKVKRLAAKCGRAYNDAAKFEKHSTALREYLETLDSERLRYCAKVVMLDSRWCEATGQGAYMA